MLNIEHTICSGCMEPVTVNVNAGTATMQVPANGKRGSLHVAAHQVTAEVLVEGDGGEGFEGGLDLAMWDCPRCGYADSVYASAETRKVM